MNRLVAHAGGFGWDEALFVALPVVVLLLLSRRARKAAEADAAEGDPSEHGSSEG